MPRLLSASQAAHYLGISSWSLRDLPDIKPVDLGVRRLLYDRVALDAYIDSLAGGERS